MVFEYENSIIFEIYLEIYGVYLAKYLAYTKDTSTFLIFYNMFIIIYLSMGGPGRGYEEYILMTLFFTLAWAIFNAICLLVISPVALIILIIKNLRTEYKWIIIFILLSIFSEAVWYYEFPAYIQDTGELIEFNIFSFLRVVSTEFISLVLAYYCLYFWSKKWQKKFLK